MMPIAITRALSPRFAECELTHLERVSIDVGLARAQHQAYVGALKRLGCEVAELPAEVDLPDSVFVEDAAIVLPEVAVIARPGANSRRGETESIARALIPYRPLVFISEPAILDGGDVLVLDKDIFVGLSTRTNQSAVQQMRSLLSRYGYRVNRISIHDCLHLKSAVTRVDSDALLINRSWVDAANFEGHELIEVDPSEPYAANILPIGRSAIYPAAFPRTRKRLEAKGFKLQTVDISELSKAEGAVTCCSLILTD